MVQEIKFPSMSRNYRVFPGKIFKCPDFWKNSQVSGTILALSQKQRLLELSPPVLIFRFFEHGRHAWRECGTNQKDLIWGTLKKFLISDFLSYLSTRTKATSAFAQVLR